MLRFSLAMVSGITFVVTAGFAFAGTQPYANRPQAHEVPELSAFTPVGDQTSFVNSVTRDDPTRSHITTPPPQSHLLPADWLLPDMQGLLPVVDSGSNQDVVTTPPSHERPKVETIAAPSAVWAGLTALLGLAMVSVIARWRRWMAH